MAESFFKFCLSGEISPNLVTLVWKPFSAFARLLLPQVLRLLVVTDSRIRAKSKVSETSDLLATSH